MKQYLDLLEKVLDYGNKREDRTGTGTYSLFGEHLRFNLEEGFPLITTKKIYFNTVIHELIWFLRGEQNTKYLRENGIKIWEPWEDLYGNVGPIYGYQWRNWRTEENYKVDQIREVISQLKYNPISRRMIVSAWNVGDLHKMSLPPCHVLFQFYVVNDKLSCHLYQRSADLFIGSPFNIASYSLLIHMIAQVANLGVGEFIYSLGDAHIYKNHVRQVEEQLSRTPFSLPTLQLNPTIKDIDDFKFEDVTIVNYKYHPHIKGEISV